MSEQSPEDALTRANDALQRGDFLAAYDAAMSARGEGITDRRLDYAAVLALARMGDAELALELYEKTGLAVADDVDMLSLEGRLKKDLAEQAPEAERPQLFAEASEAYLGVYTIKGGYFPAINAATTAMLAGKTEQAHRLAREILNDPEIVDPIGYYATATKAEAHLLLGDAVASFDSMQKAAACADAGVGPKASTCNQMMLIASILPDRAEAVAPLVELLRPAPVVFYTGHMFAEDAASEAVLRDRIDAELDDIEPSAGYGALACGSDILVAEALIERGCELHVVLPFDQGDFVAQSVEPGGQGWVKRFIYCLDAAHTVSFATDMTFIGDPQLFTYGSSVAMGLALMRARHLHTHAIQLAILESEDGIKPAGTAKDVALWRELDNETRLIDPGAIDRNFKRPPSIAMPKGVSRVAHSMIFADFEGFSKLDEPVLPVFVSEILGTIGTVLDRHDHNVLYRNSWGDALYAVVSDPVDAAEIVLELQAALSDIPQQLSDCAGECGMRISVHHGPIYTAHDGVMGRMSFFGTEVTRTARIEPVTPKGEVYTTEAFAAMLALQNERRYGTHYVGRIDLAKNYGQLAMYKLSRQGD